MSNESNDPKVVLGYQSGDDRFIQKWSGPSIRAWQQFADEAGGEYIPAIAANFDFGIGKPVPCVGRVMAPIGPWTAEFHTAGQSDSPDTCARVPLIAVAALRFRIRRAGPWYYIGELLGLRDIRIGHFLFDDAFEIRGNDAAKIAELLSDTALRDLIVRFDDIRVSLDPVWRRRPPAAALPLAELRLQSGGILDRDQLWRVYRLLERALEGMCRIGATRAQSPGGSPFQTAQTR